MIRIISVLTSEGEMHSYSWETIDGWVRGIPTEMGLWEIFDIKPIFVSQKENDNNSRLKALS